MGCFSTLWHKDTFSWLLSAIVFLLLFFTQLEQSARCISVCSSISSAALDKLSHTVCDPCDTTSFTEQHTHKKKPGLDQFGFMQIVEIVSTSKIRLQNINFNVLFFNPTKVEMCLSLLHLSCLKLLIKGMAQYNFFMSDTHYNIASRSICQYQYQFNTGKPWAAAEGTISLSTACRLKSSWAYGLRYLIEWAIVVFFCSSLKFFTIDPQYWIKSSLSYNMFNILLFIEGLFLQQQHVINSICTSCFNHLLVGHEHLVNQLCNFTVANWTFWVTLPPI